MARRWSRLQPRPDQNRLDNPRCHLAGPREEEQDRGSGHPHPGPDQDVTGIVIADIYPGEADQGGGEQQQAAEPPVNGHEHHRDRERGGRVVARKRTVGGMRQQEVDLSGMSHERPGTIPDMTQKLVGQERQAGREQGQDGLITFGSTSAPEAVQEPAHYQCDEGWFGPAGQGHHHRIDKRQMSRRAVDQLLEAVIHQPGGDPRDGAVEAGLRALKTRKRSQSEGINSTMPATITISIAVRVPSGAAVDWIVSPGGTR